MVRQDYIARFSCGSRDAKVLTPTRGLGGVAEHGSLQLAFGLLACSDAPLH